MRMKAIPVQRLRVNTRDRIVDRPGANGLQKSDIDWLVPHQATSALFFSTPKTRHEA